MDRICCIALSVVFFVGMHAQEKDRKARAEGYRTRDEAYQALINKLKTQPWGKVAEKCISELDQEEHTIIDQFAAHGIQLKLRETRKDVLQNSWPKGGEEWLKETGLTVLSQVPQVLEEELKEHGISNLLVVCNDISGKITPRAATLHEFFIIGPSFFSRSLVHQQAITKHEIAHVLHADSALESYIRSHLLSAAQSGLIDEATLNKFYGSYRVFIEKRANVIAMLHGSEYAAEIIEDLRNQPSRHNEFVSALNIQKQINELLLKVRFMRNMSRIACQRQL